MPRCASLRLLDVPPWPTRHATPYGKSRNGIGALRYRNDSAVPALAAGIDREPGRIVRRPRLRCLRSARLKSGDDGGRRAALPAPAWMDDADDARVGRDGGRSAAADVVRPGRTRCRRATCTHVCTLSFAARADGDDEPQVVSLDEVVEDRVAVLHDRRRGILREPEQVFAVVLAEDRIDERVEKEIRARDAEVAQEVLHPRAGAADERAVAQRLVLRAFLSDDEDAHGARRSAGRGRTSGRSASGTRRGRSAPRPRPR